MIRLYGGTIRLTCIDMSISLVAHIDWLLDTVNLLFEIGMLMFIKHLAHISFIRHSYLFICFSNSFINNFEHLNFRVEVALWKLLWYLVRPNWCRTSIYLLLILFICIHVRHICHKLSQMLIEYSDSWGVWLNYFRKILITILL